MYYVERQLDLEFADTLNVDMGFYDVYFNQGGLELQVDILEHFLFSWYVVL